METQIIRVKHLAKMLSISVPTLYRWHEKGQIPIEKIKIGPGVVGYRKKDIEDWLAGKLDLEPETETA